MTDDPDNPDNCRDLDGTGKFGEIEMTDQMKDVSQHKAARAAGFGLLIMSILQSSLIFLYSRN
jgi:hypothetical protein